MTKTNCPVELKKCNSIAEFYAELGVDVSCSLDVVHLLNNDTIKTEELMEFVAQIRLMPEAPHESDEITAITCELNNTEVAAVVGKNTIILCLPNDIDRQANSIK